ncbi:hypothetical protein [Vibrio agarivorans]|uniref:DUF3221 domain-containing protein n=1 Tax=Vibrio agarivorans TaxID=153622 RepID=A0ABT7Y6Z2_9VIBR|nr:hypothetical protein [Vibrio agarivorans]MDN2483816.1 hypothetical protein [Vibrio agarivorans]
MKNQGLILIFALLGLMVLLNKAEASEGIFVNLDNQGGEIVVLVKADDRSVNERRLLNRVRQIVNVTYTGDPQLAPTDRFIETIKMEEYDIRVLLFQANEYSLGDPQQLIGYKYLID